MTTVFTIAGFDESRSSRQKLKVLNNTLTARGYRVVPVDMTWGGKNHQQFVAEFMTLYQNEKTDNNIIIGNSFGATVAFIAAPVLCPDKIILCSLSAYFSEDRNKESDERAISKFGKDRALSIWSYSANDIAMQIDLLDIKTVVTYGEMEKELYPYLVHRCTEVASHISKSELIEVKGAPHNLSDELYSRFIAGPLLG